MSINGSITFRKGSSEKNISVKLFQNVTSGFREDFFKEFHVWIVQVASINKSQNFWRIRISQTTIEKGYPRNISATLFQNLTSGFAEGFLRISLFPCSVRSPNSPEPCLLAKIHFFRKRVTKGTFLWNYVKIWQLLRKFYLVVMATRVFDAIIFFFFFFFFFLRTSQGPF